MFICPVLHSKAILLHFMASCVFFMVRTFFAIRYFFFCDIFFLCLLIVFIPFARFHFLRCKTLRVIAFPIFILVFVVEVFGVLGFILFYLCFPFWVWFQMLLYRLWPTIYSYFHEIFILPPCPKSAECQTLAISSNILTFNRNQFHRQYKYSVIWHFNCVQNIFFAYSPWCAQCAYIYKHEHSPKLRIENLGLVHVLQFPFFHSGSI